VAGVVELVFTSVGDSLSWRLFAGDTQLEDVSRFEDGA